VPYTQADLDTIRAARLRGIRTVEFRGPDGRGRTTTYQSDAEMRQVEADIAASLATSVQDARPRQVQLVADKGFDC